MDPSAHHHLFVGGPLSRAQADDVCATIADLDPAQRGIRPEDLLDMRDERGALVVPFPHLPCGHVLDYEDTSLLMKARVAFAWHVGKDETGAPAAWIHDPDVGASIAMIWTDESGAILAPGHTGPVPAQIYALYERLRAGPVLMGDTQHQILASHPCGR